jgi:hypothetical protein
MQRLGTVITIVISLLVLGACAEATPYPAQNTGGVGYGGGGSGGGSMGGHGGY